MYKRTRTMTDLAPLILIVDDDAQQGSNVGRYLEANHYRTSVVGHGAAGWVQLPREHLDLVVLDVGMPSMEGYLFCKWLREDPRTRAVPVLFTSELCELKHKVYAYLQGISTYLI